MERRRVLCGLAGMGIVAAALSACSDDNDTSSQSQPEAGKDASGQTVLASKADIAVGSGVVVTASGQPVVVVQPSSGQFKAFDARGTHQGTTVKAPKDNVMVCPNHGSQFSATNGFVVQSPASQPLSPIDIRVDGDNILLA